MSLANSDRAKGNPVDHFQTLILFVLTIFTSATILFLVQPMVGKILLPFLGGTPAVWNTCMVFFQGLLLAGYFYSHMITTRLPLRAQVTVHLCVLGTALAVLLLLRFDIEPLTKSITWLEPPTESNPIPWLLTVLLIAAGPPFFAVSTSAPLIQRWFSRTGHPQSADPYFLYAASNLGSMIALVGYPFVVEPSLTLESQRWLWVAGFMMLVALTALCGFLALRNDTEPADSDSSNGNKRSEHDNLDLPVEPLTWARRLRWIMLAAVPSSLMLGATTYMTTDIAAIPLLWIPPLALYLLSFIFVFGRMNPIISYGFMAALPLACMLLIFMVITEIRPGNILLSVGIHLTVLFIVSMVCHGELAKDRPEPAHLTEFYLYMSLGGVIGGLFNGLIAPLAFFSLAEYPIALLVACALCPPLGREADDTPSTRLAEWGLAGLALFGSLVLFILRGTDQDVAYRTWSNHYLTGALVGGFIAWLITAHLSGQLSYKGLMDCLLPLSMGILVLALLLGTYSDALFTPLKSLSKSVGLGFTQIQAILAIGVPLVICYTFVDRSQRLALGTGAVLLAATINAMGEDSSLTQRRGFFGVLQVENRKESDGRFRRLLHGTTLHGKQFLDPDMADIPLTYYHRSGPIGQVMTSCLADGYAGMQPKGKVPLPKVAVIGLGTGTMACYARAGQELVFFDIDPLVRQMSFDGRERYFSFVEDAKRRGAQVELRMGDARIRMAKEPDASYDLIAVDAFSSDAIPVHLITLEALRIFVTKLKDKGIVAFHVSNRYLDLVPVLANLAQEEKLAILFNSDGSENWPGKTASTWVALSRNKESLAPLLSSRIGPGQAMEVYQGLLALPTFASTTPGTGRGLAYAMDKLVDSNYSDLRIKKLGENPTEEDKEILERLKRVFLEPADVLASPAGGVGAAGLLFNGVLPYCRGASLWREPLPNPKVGLWTDDYSNLIAVWNRKHNDNESIELPPSD
ncbi:MAG: hypothetical protein NTZ71_03315 [Planctomycetota bacterium]|nr:hypothetical protein [Planctomycetota bacterium]